MAFNLQSTLLSSPTAIKQSIAKADAYNRLKSFKAEDLANLLPSEDRDPESQISTAQLQQIIDSIPADLLQRVAEQSFDAYYDALRGGRASIGIDIREIKRSAFSSIPEEFKSEIDKSVPDTYEVKINNKNPEIWKFILNKYSKFYSLIFIGLSLIFALLLGQGAKGKLRCVATLLLIGGVIAFAFYYVMRVLPIDKLINISNNTSSHMLLLLLKDVVIGLIKPVVNMFRSEWIYAFVLSVMLYATSFIFNRSKTIINATPQIPQHMIQNTSVNSTTKDSTTR